MTDDTAAVDAALDYANSIRPYRDSFTTCERHLLTLADTLAQRTDGPTAPEPAALTLAQVDRFHNEVCIPDGGRCKCPEPAGSITDQSGEALLARQTGQGGADGVARRTAQTTDLMVPSASPLAPESAAQPSAALDDLSDDEAYAVDRFMNEHMYHHRHVAQVAHMGCDARCRTQALAEAFRQEVLVPRRAARPDPGDPDTAAVCNDSRCEHGGASALYCPSLAPPAPGATTGDTDGGA